MSMDKMIAAVTTEEKVSVLEILERGAGSPYNRAVLALLADERKKTLVRVCAWLKDFSKEVSTRGKDDGRPEAIHRTARDALAIRSAASLLLKLEKLPDPPEVVSNSLLMGMTLEEASAALQQHSPWNGKPFCDQSSSAELQLLDNIKALIEAHEKENS